ncbi:MAG: hypothetical protein V4489_05465 [Chlamydiota bacterium]
MNCIGGCVRGFFEIFNSATEADYTEEERDFSELLSLNLKLNRSSSGTLVSSYGNYSVGSNDSISDLFGEKTESTSKSSSPSIQKEEINQLLTPDLDDVKPCSIWSKKVDDRINSETSTIHSLKVTHIESKKKSKGIYVPQKSDSPSIVAEQGNKPMIRKTISQVFKPI